MLGVYEANVSYMYVVCEFIHLAEDKHQPSIDVTMAGHDTITRDLHTDISNSLYHHEW